MLTGLLWLDVLDATAEIDAAEARGVDPGVIRNLRDALAQAERDGDDDSVWAISQAAARWGPAGSQTVQTPTDVVVGGAVDVARKAETASATLTLLVVGLLVLVAWTARR